MVPIFTTHYSIGESILTTEPPSKVAKGETDSIFSIAEDYSINPIHIVEDNLSGFIELYKNAQITKKQIVFGLKINICKNLEKNEDSLKDAHSVIIWMLNSQGYYDLLKIYNKAATENFYYYSRITEKELKEFWTKNLTITLPFYSSFIAKNTLTFSSCIFDVTWFKASFHIENNELPFDNIIKDSIEKYNQKYNLNTILCKTIYYRLRQNFKTFQTFKAICSRTNLNAPNMEYMSSKEFCIESWKENVK